MLFQSQKNNYFFTFPQTNATHFFLIKLIKKQYYVFSNNIQAILQTDGADILGGSTVNEICEAYSHCTDLKIEQLSKADNVTKKYVLLTLDFNFLAESLKLNLTKALDKSKLKHNTHFTSVYLENIPSKLKFYFNKEVEIAFKRFSTSMSFLNGAMQVVPLDSDCRKEMEDCYNILLSRFENEGRVFLKQCGFQNKDEIDSFIDMCILPNPLCS